MHCGDCQVERAPHAAPLRPCSRSRCMLCEEARDGCFTRSAPILDSTAGWGALRERWLAPVPIDDQKEQQVAEGTFWPGPLTRSPMLPSGSQPRPGNKAHAIGQLSCPPCAYRYPRTRGPIAAVFGSAGRASPHPEGSCCRNPTHAAPNSERVEVRPPTATAIIHNRGN